MDARVLKTHARFIECFNTMLEEMPFEEITVNELCARASIRRATFYKHYTDKYDFLKFFVSSLRDKFDATIWKREKPDATLEYYVVYLRSLIEFLTSHKKIVQHILSSEIMPTVVNIIIDQNYEDTCDRIRKSVEDGLVIPASVETVATMMTGAVSYAVINWFKRGMPTPAEDFLQELSSVIKVLKI